MYDLIRWLVPWMQSLSDGRKPLSDGVPWVTFAARAEMQKIVGPSSHVFEYGTGGSTVYFAQRVSRVIAVEHDSEWRERVVGRLADRDNVEVRFVAPEEDSPEPDRHAWIYRASNPQLSGWTFRAYASSIDEFPDGSFDLVLIDGRARVGCFAHAHRKVRQDGYIVVDNSERPVYDAIREAAIAGGWGAKYCFGPGPYNAYFWETTVWHKTAELPADVMSHGIAERARNV